ncbi:hypothetical protein V1478_014480 [Vespula squamosa]|uniref:Uncharacterized protein n=1 Tax=Vespula squamosa TaxID=30214 RepID=A0ABD2A841_VESSQ
MLFVDGRTFVIIFLLIYSATARNTNGQDFRKEINNKKSGSMLAEIAKEFMQRSTTTSQVLNLNLSNLLLLLVLKAVVFGAGYIGNHGYKGRDLNEENIISEGEVALALGYLIGDTCLYRAACEEPHIANEYLGAAEMLLNTIKLMPQTVSVEHKYEKTISELRKAIEYGITSGCPPEYNCKKENIKAFLTTEKKK